MQNTFLHYLILGSLAFALLACGPAQEAEVGTANTPPDPAEIFALAQEKYLAAATTLDTAAGLPRNAYADGSWRQVPARDWTSGFFPGILWQIYAYTEDPEVAKVAAKWTKKLYPMRYYDGNHDIGFMLFSSYGNAFRLTGDSSYYAPLLTGAETGITRFNPASGVIKSWDFLDGRNPTIIDNMMNLRLYAFAFEETGDSTFYRVIKSHADTTLVHHFRPDGGTWHVVDYDPEGGGARDKFTHQGWSDESLWARGQAWAIYGFTQTYRHLPDPKYLETARRAADLFIERLPADTLPYWDFDAPNIPREEKDASAAAIAASAFLDLADLTGEDRYRSAAIDLLTALSTPEQLAGTEDQVGGLLKHSVGNRKADDPVRGEVDMHINYADYYYLEALNKLGNAR